MDRISMPKGAPGGTPGRDGAPGAIGGVTRQARARASLRAGRLPSPAPKLSIPRVPAAVVGHTRALGRLCAAPDHTLTLVSAPAGAGKTTVLARWARACETPLAWVTLDAGDNDPVRFCASVLAALAGVIPGARAEVRSSTRSTEPPGREALLTALGNALATAPERTVLVLDEYQTLREDNDQIHELVALLLEHLPDDAHLVIGSRTAPPLPLARLRAHGQLLELRWDDLRLSPEEVRAFLHTSTGLRLGEDEIVLLQAQTEGWVTGLHLAALALRGGAGTDLIAGLGGAHHRIVDYLRAEVLARQAPAIQEFLMRTAVLERLCGPLCDAVTASSRDARPAPSGHEMLEALERANLFLIPLDDERRWFRYHPLFAAMLRLCLEHRERGLAPVLLQRASHWYEREGQVDEALRYAMRARYVARAGGLVAAGAGRIHAATDGRAAAPRAPDGGSDRDFSPTTSRAAALTERELEVLRLLADGASNQQIACALVIEVSTVKRHLSNIYVKLKVQRRTQAIAWAHALHVLPAAE